MTAEMILTRCREGEQEVQRLQRRLSRLQSVGAIAGTLLDDIETCQAALSLRCRELDAETIAACRIVDRLPDPVCSVMYRYYIARQTQDMIAAALHISVSYYKRLKRDGLAHIRHLDDALVDAMLPEWYHRDA